MTQWEMDRHEGAELAKFIHQLRKRTGGPDWHRAGIESALAEARRRAPAPDLAIAAIKAARVPTNRTPAIIGMDGPHWQGATNKPTPTHVEPVDRCSVCSLHRDQCGERWGDDHEFRPSHQRPEVEDTAERVKAMKVEAACHVREPDPEKKPIPPDPNVERLRAAKAAGPTEPDPARVEAAAEVVGA